MNNKHIILPLLIASALSYNAVAHAAELIIHHSPLFLTNKQKANVLVIMDNSNSMDESANGSAVGGTDPNSKSEIARNAVSDLITEYTGKINMGLMAYQQSGVSLRHLHNSPYDASFDPANYDPSYTGDRDSTTKRFRTPNLSSPGNFIYYNIALPFYASSNQSDRYCYTTTADFDNGSETYPAGPWDSYRCFRNKLTTSDTVPNWGNSTSETNAGFTSYAFGGAFSPTDSDLAQNLLDFGTFLTWNWVSRTWFSNSSPGRGYLHTPIEELDAAQAAALNLKLAPSQWVTNGPTDPTLPLQNAGLTPLEGTLYTALDYFDNTALPSDEGGPVSAVPESCDKNFIALLTDGLPSTDQNGNVTTNPTTALAAVATAAEALHAIDVETYTIGFALPFGTDPTALDSIASAGGTDTAYLADDPVTLQATFDAIFSDILEKTGASSSAATNSTSLSANSLVYQARFNSGDWSGQLLARSISTSGSISLTNEWDAADELKSIDQDDRVILTYNRDTNDGMPFRWTNINAQTDTTLKDMLNTEPVTAIPDGIGADRTHFLRGGDGNLSAALLRADRNGKLGDIVHSAPAYVGPPSAGYNDVIMSGYSAFASSKSSRKPIIYVGANDGMLHGFDASTASSKGDEVLAYIPKSVSPHLNELTAIGYGNSTLPHRYFVDTTPAFADADVNGWKTILAGGLGAGGQGIYALDITSPTSGGSVVGPNSTVFDEANAANIVLWEFTDEDDADLGYTFFDPVRRTATGQSAQIARMANDEWALIIGNGYNNTEADGHASTTGHAVLFILFIEKGLDGTWTVDASTTDYVKIDTGVGSTTTPNGLATPMPYDTDNDGNVDVIYAGDLEGNLWKFDVSSSTVNSWTNASNMTKLFTAAAQQSITTAPLVTKSPGDGYMIGVGTGKYVELSDIGTSSVQSFYGIWDDGVTSSTATRSDLVEQTVLAEETVTENGETNTFRITSQYDVDYDTYRGWYIDLPTTGERVDVNPLLRSGRFVFATRIPSTAQCVAGGTSWLMELDYLTGGRLDESPFDTNNDGIIDENDYISVTYTDSSGTDITISVPVSGVKTDDGMISTPTVTYDPNSPDQEIKINANSTGTLEVELESVGGDYSGRLTWKELR